jgi:arylsulfatase
MNPDKTSTAPTRATSGEADSNNRDGLRNGDPAHGWQGTIGRTLADSTPWWTPRGKAPDGAPDVVVILLDDLGFSDFGCYGAEIATPNIDRLAANGLRFANYTTVPMCTPARAALLTGKNPHSVGCGWLTFNDPGYPGYRGGEIAEDAPTLAELLREQHYSTYAAGKWHNTAEHNVVPSADRSAWPLQRGFDRFYGFIGGETHYFAPFHVIEDNAMVDHDRYADDYYCTDDWTDAALAWLKQHVSATPDKPFFLYLPYNAPHAPLHAKPQDLARYRGRYDAGWDAIRDARIRRQRESGLLPGPWDAPGHSPGVPAWNDVDAPTREVYARYMELYAAVVDNIDQNVGRVVATLAELGRLDNTLIVVTSDNGANGIGGVDGAANNLAKRITRSEDPQKVRKLYESGRLGASETWPTYPLGWTDTSTAPFRLYKTTTMNGGMRVPFVAHWPKGIADRGATRQQWVHVTDIVPTVMDLLGADYPPQRDGYRTRKLDGVSFAPLLADAAAPSARHQQHYELAGNRGFIRDGWKIVSLQPPGSKIDLDNWMLFDLARDPAEVHDLARERPDRLRELVAAFDVDAEANYVYPLDNRDVRRSLTVPPYLEDDINRARTFYPDAGTAPIGVVAPLIADRSYTLTCRFECTRGNEGVVFALGDSIAGFALYVRDGALRFAYNGGQSAPVEWHAPAPTGDVSFELRHAATGKRRGEGTILVNGHALGKIDMSPTTLLGLGVGEGLDVGLDRKLRVTEGYGVPGTFAYSGRIGHVRIEPGPQAPDSYANRAELASQRD